MAEVEIYTKMTCPYCIRAKKLFEIKRIPFKEIAVDFGGPEKAKMVERSGGRTTVPQIFINGRHVGGCDDVMELEQMGKLDEALAA
ncbi:glutaredoxin 3 [Sphingomonas xanthus]|uniref:Glutaredoxin n=1 Tax=Sphingomonas xanthus TaxID=2594473 RepID=A0A516ITC2_9SPHN|nr:glutaredoxin 3 [Sphingomonas xanthus]QDP20127.1 glutaredoxin 3 [Sphingomonas xanthus]